MLGVDLDRLWLRVQEEFSERLDRSRFSNDYVVVEPALTEHVLRVERKLDLAVQACSSLCPDSGQGHARRWESPCKCLSAACLSEDEDSVGASDVACGDESPLADQRRRRIRS